MKNKYPLILLLLLSLISHGREPIKIQSHENKLSGLEKSINEKIKSHTYNLNGIYGEKLILIKLNGKTLDSNSFYITIDSINHTIKGRSGCNDFTINFKNTKGRNRIETSMPRGTMISCEKEIMDLEHKFISALTNRKLKLFTRKNIIYFKDLKNKTVLQFTRYSQNDIWSFIGRNNWKLIQMENTGKDFGQVLISFDTVEKKISGNSSCNNFFGSYKADAGHIKFDKIGTTKMFCSDDEKNKNEQKILTILSSGELHFDLVEQTLNFYLDNKLIMIFAMVKL